MTHMEPPGSVSDSEEPLAWCVVANVAGRTRHGPGGQEIQRGLRHFVAGAKVWVLPPQWGDAGDSVIVVGRHRGAARRGYVRVVIQRRHLTTFRVRGIYRPAVLRVATAPWPTPRVAPRLWESRDEAEQRAQWWQAAEADH